MLSLFSGDCYSYADSLFSLLDVDTVVTEHLTTGVIFRAGTAANGAGFIVS